MYKKRLFFAIELLNKNGQLVYGNADSAITVEIKRVFD